MSKFWINYSLKRYSQEYERVLLDLVEKNPKVTYLDCGCKDGLLTLRVAEGIGTRNINALELVDEYVGKANNRGILCIKHDLNKPFPFPDSSFDVVTANQIIEHLDNTDIFCREIYRVLKLGGYAIVSTNNLAAFHCIIQLILGKQPSPACISDEIVVTNCECSGEYKKHRRLFTFDGLVKLLRYHGFKIEKEVGSSYFPFPVWLARIMCIVDRNHSQCINIKVRKE